MISESAARQLIADRAAKLQAEPCPLDAVLGRTLAEDVASDIDSPPYDKALVDGYAVRSADFTAAAPDTVTSLRVLEEVTAGRPPTLALEPGGATRIMTGAPLPSGADAVVMVENATLQGEHVALRGEARPEQHCLRAGAAMRRGDVVVRAGTRLRAIELGVLAEVGCVHPHVARRPTVAIVSTGDELTTADQTPQPGQIRNSNGPMLAAQATEAGAWAQSLGIVRDDLAMLEARIKEGLASDVLVLSGGVSAGALDLVPPALERCGVERVFHKVAIKPGKPVWFGCGSGGTLVFGLPGNPVGSLVCFERLVRPALRQMSGERDAFTSSDAFAARLGEAFLHRGERPTYRPAVAVAVEPSLPTVTPVAWQGSADLSALARANCLIAFPAGDQEHPPGETLWCHPLLGRAGQ